MSLLNQKAQKINFSNKHYSIVIPKIDFINCKNYLKDIKAISNRLNDDSKRKNIKIEITDINQNNKNKVINQEKYMNNKNIIIKDSKKSKKTKLYFFIKNADTLTIKNNNFKLFHINYINKFHSFEDLNSPKKNLKFYPVSNNSIKKNNKRNISDKLENINLLTNKIKTNELQLPKESNSIKFNKKIIDGHNIKTFNQFFKPRFINEKSHKFINNLNKIQNNIKNKILIKKEYSQNIPYYNKFSKNNNRNQQFFNSSKSCTSFNNLKKKFISKSRNSLSVLNEDDIETFKKDDNSSNSILDYSSLDNNKQIPKSDIIFFETPKQINYDYIQSPIEFQYESDFSSNQNTINNENDINKICSNLKNVKILEIQKKDTNMENDTINCYEQMVEKDEINPPLFFNIKINRTNYLSKSVDISKNGYDNKQIKIKIESKKDINTSFKKYITDIAKYKSKKNMIYKNKENNAKHINRMKLNRNSSYIKNSFNLIIKIYFDKVKNKFINRLKKLNCKKNLNINQSINKQNNGSKILKNKTTNKIRNINFIEIREGEYLQFNKSFSIKDDSFAYFKKIYTKSNNIFDEIKRESIKLNKSFIKNMNKMRIKKELIFPNNHVMEIMNKNKKINKSIIKTDLTERTTDSKSLKINSFGEYENDMINELY